MQSSRPLKIALGGLLLIAIVSVGLLLMNKSKQVVAPSVTTGQAVKAPSQKQVKDKNTPVSIPVEEATQEAKAIQEKVNTGTLSPQDAVKQLNAIGDKIPVPPAPTSVKK